MSEQLEAMRAELQEKFEPWAIDQGCSICKNKYERYTELETIWAWEGYQAASAQLIELRKSHKALFDALDNCLSRGNMPPHVARQGEAALSQAKELK